VKRVITKVNSQAKAGELHLLCDQPGMEDPTKLSKRRHLQKST
jgi:hypothetical protein